MSLSKKTTNWIMGGLAAVIFEIALVPVISNYIENRKYNTIRANSNRLSPASNSLLDRYVESEMPKDSLESYSNRKPENLI